MTDHVTMSTGIIDQRGMSAGERFEVACVLREGWWDCYGVFMEEVVDLGQLGLTPRSLDAMSADFEDAGYMWHAAAARAAARPTRPRGDTLDQTFARRRARAHRESGAMARR